MLDDLLRRHDGVITSSQAETAGLSQDAIDRRVRSGHWRRCSRGVYFAARLRAAVWSYGGQAAASGLAAAWWFDITKFAPDVIEVTVPRAVMVVATTGLGFGAAIWHRPTWWSAAVYE